jgi:hypothetical protein
VKKRAFLVALAGAPLFAVAGAAAAADKPARLKVVETVDIAAPPAKIWEIIKNYNDMSWHPAIKKDDATNGNVPGSVRTLDLGGPKLTETLMKYDSAKMSYSYRINNDPENVKAVPATDYRSRIQVKSGPNHTAMVVWSGTFHRGDPGPDPSPEMNDDTATKTIHTIYRAGLDNLKKLAEASS